MTTCGPPVEGRCRCQRADPAFGVKSSRCRPRQCRRLGEAQCRHASRRTRDRRRAALSTKSTSARRCAGERTQPDSVTKRRVVVTADGRAGEALVRGDRRAHPLVHLGVAPVGAAGLAPPFERAVRPALGALVGDDAHLLGRDERRRAPPGTRLKPLVACANGSSWTRSESAAAACAAAAIAHATAIAARASRRRSDCVMGSARIARESAARRAAISWRHSSVAVGVVGLERDPAIVAGAGDADEAELALQRRACRERRRDCALSASSSRSPVARDVSGLDVNS